MIVFALDNTERGSDNNDQATSSLATTMGNETDSQTAADSHMQTLLRVPVFITELDITDPDKRQQVQNTVNDMIKEKGAGRTDTTPISFEGSNYSVTEVSAEIKIDMLSNPMFSNALLRYCEMIKNGAAVTEINCFVKSNPYE